MIDILQYLHSNENDHSEIFRISRIRVELIELEQLLALNKFFQAVKSIMQLFFHLQ